MVGKGGQRPHAQAADCPSQQCGVEGVADVVVLFLEDAERSVVAGQFVEIEADERNQCSGRDDKGQAAEKCSSPGVRPTLLTNTHFSQLLNEVLSNV